MVERYSPPRIVREARLRACAGKTLKPGWSLGPTADDPETGKPWNLADGNARAKPTKLITENKPLCVFLCPMCTALSQMQNISEDRRDAQAVKRELEEGKDLIRWAMRVCSLQHRHNRYFAFEHPGGASSWNMPEVQKAAKLERVQTVKLDMCQYGMTMVGPFYSKAKPAKTRTKIITNSPEVARIMSMICPGQHKHTHLSKESLDANALRYFHGS